MNTILNTFISPDMGVFSWKRVLPYINKCFGEQTVEGIMSNLTQLSQSSADKVAADWAKQTIETLQKMSPTSLKVTLELMRRGRQSSFKSCFRMECTLAANMLDRVPDLYEGISAKLVRKQTSAAWNPSSIEDVDLAFVKGLFEPTKTTPQVAFESYADDFYEYPHGQYVLPTTSRIKAIIQNSQHLQKWDAIQDSIMTEFNNKPGLAEKLQYIRQHHLTKDLKWID